MPIGPQGQKRPPDVIARAVMRAQAREMRNSPLSGGATSRKKRRRRGENKMRWDTKVFVGSIPSFMLPLVGFESRKAAQISAFFALKSIVPKHGVIEKLKLIKLIYFSEREYLRRYHLPMLFDEFYSLPHGPICSATLNGIDGKLDDDDETVWSEFIARNGNIVVAVKKFARDSFDAISNREMKMLKFIWHRFGEMTASQLRNYSHENCPEYTEIEKGRIPISYREVMEALGVEKSEAESIEDSVRDIRRKESISTSVNARFQQDQPYAEDVTVVSFQEYARIEECMKNPAPPTQAVLEGAELLRSLRRSSR